jgi:hypothetical protein
MAVSCIDQALVLIGRTALEPRHYCDGEPVHPLQSGAIASARLKTDFHIYRPGSVPQPLRGTPSPRRSGSSTSARAAPGCLVRWPGRLRCHVGEPASAIRIVGVVWRGITSWLTCRPVALGYPECDHKHPGVGVPKYLCQLTGQVKGLLRHTETPQARDTAAVPHGRNDTFRYTYYAC